MKGLGLRKLRKVQSISYPKTSMDDVNTYVKFGLSKHRPRFLHVGFENLCTMTSFCVKHLDYSAALPTNVMFKVLRI